MADSDTPTKFEEVYKAFLDSIDSYDFAKVDDDELEDVLWGYLDHARIQFLTYYKDLNDVDVDKKQFNIHLNPAEIAILAKGMKLEWVSQTKHSEDLMKKAIGDRDYTAIQGYRYLEDLSAMEKQLQKEIKTWINTYEYSMSDLYEDML